MYPVQPVPRCGSFGGAAGSLKSASRETGTSGSAVCILWKTSGAVFASSAAALADGPVMTTLTPNSAMAHVVLILGTGFPHDICARVPRRFYMTFHWIIVM